jgi:hypothetical protein
MGFSLRGKLGTDFVWRLGGFGQANGWLLSRTNRGTKKYDGNVVRSIKKRSLKVGTQVCFRAVHTLAKKLDLLK